MKKAIERLFSLWDKELITTEELLYRTSRIITDPELYDQAAEHIVAMDREYLPDVALVG